MQVTLLSFLSPCAQATWGLSNVEAASIASAVFGGELVGALVLGQAADHFGRRPLYFVSCFLILVPGLISVVAPNYGVLLAARTLVGLGVGGLTVPFTILAECLRTKDRGPILLFIEIFWTLGSMFTAAAAWIVLRSSGWRILALICAAPVLVSILAGAYLPESPRWLLINGRHDEALAIMHKIAEVNGNMLPEGLTLIGGPKPENPPALVNIFKSSSEYEIT